MNPISPCSAAIPETSGMSGAITGMAKASASISTPLATAR
jgi:hypothetical protein